MFLRPSLGFFVKTLDVLLELLAVHTPYASTTDLDRGQLAGADERIDLRHADAQIFRHIVQGEKSCLDLGHRRMTIAANGAGYLNLKAFALVWRAVAGDELAWR